MFLQLSATYKIAKLVNLQDLNLPQLVTLDLRNLLLDLQGLPLDLLDLQGLPLDLPDLSLVTLDLQSLLLDLQNLLLGLQEEEAHAVSFYSNNSNNNNNNNNNNNESFVSDVDPDI